MSSFLWQQSSQPSIGGNPERSGPFWCWVCPISTKHMWIQHWNFTQLSWWYTYPSEKYESVGMMTFPIYGKPPTNLAFRIGAPGPPRIPSNLLASSLDVHSTVAQLLNPLNHRAWEILPSQKRSKKYRGYTMIYLFSLRLYPEKWCLTPNLPSFCQRSLEGLVGGITKRDIDTNTWGCINTHNMLDKGSRVLVADLQYQHFFPSTTPELRTSSQIITV
jgi:hypothetical protein